MHWTPHPRTVVVFSIDFLYGWYPPRTAPVVSLSIPGRLRARQEFYSRFGIPFKEYGHARVPLRDPRWPAILDAVADETARGGLALRGDGCCWLEEPPPRRSDPTAWFQVGFGPTDYTSPKRIPASAHVAYVRDVHAVSDTFIEAVRVAGLTGLDWLPLEETRPGDARRWYQVFATHPLGRGVDHPLADPAALTRKHLEYNNRSSVSRRCGQEVAWLGERGGWRKDVRIDDPIVRRLLDLGNPEFFRVAGTPRFVREHLPPTDFAYEGWPWDNDPKPGTRGRGTRGVCCNARARGVLLETGLVKPSRFETFATVPADKANNVILDREIADPLPLPEFTPEEAARERARREAIIARAAPAAASLTFGSIEDAIAFLEARMAAGTLPWTSSKGTPELAQFQASTLFSRAPEAWRRVQPLLPLETPQPQGKPDGDNAPLEFMLVAPEWNDWLPSEPTEDPADSPSKKDLVLARTIYGDWFAVRVGDPLLPTDARIVWWDHETLTIKDEWPNVAAFVAHVVEAFGAA